MLNNTTILVILLVLGLCLIVVALAPRNAMARSVVYRLTHPVTRPAEPAQKHKSVRQPFWNIRTVAAPHAEVPVDLYVYQVDAAGKKIRAKTGLHLPKEPGQFTEILPPHGKPSADAFESVWLADTPTVKTVSHASPLKVYMGFDKKLYLETNEQNFNPSYNKIVVFIDRSPAECYNKFRMLWIGMYHLPQRRFSGGSNHSFFVEMLIS